ncbi:MAG: hypothetical protein ACRDJO_01030 [Actinomycetota bacterium]
MTDIEQADGTGRSPRVRRPLVVLLLLAAAAVVVSVVVAVAAPGPRLDASSPESVVARYLQAVIDRDSDAATYLSAGTAERCATTLLRDAWIPPSLTATLDDVEVRGNEAEVVVRLRSVPAPPPFGGGFSSIERFTVVRASAGDPWRIAGDPWPVYACGGPYEFPVEVPERGSEDPR